MKAITWLATITMGVGTMATHASAATTADAAPLAEPPKASDATPAAEPPKPADATPAAEPPKPAETAQATTLDGWSADLDKALEKAKADKKCVLLEFTGSDWCPPCIAMRKNVFSKTEFVTAAAKNFILVELDFPRGDKELADKHQPFLKKYKVTGFPTVVLLDPEGKEFTRFFASQFPKLEDFVKHLDEALEKKDLD